MDGHLPLAWDVQQPCPQQHDSYDDNEGGGDNDNSIMIDLALQTQCAHSPSLVLPPAYSRARAQAVSDLQNTMSFSSPLESTFALPSHVYGRMLELPLVDWSLTDNDDDSSKTKSMLLEELDELQLNLHAARLVKYGP